MKLDHSLYLKDEEERVWRSYVSNTDKLLEQGINNFKIKMRNKRNILVDIEKGEGDKYVVNGK